MPDSPTKQSSGVSIRWVVFGALSMVAIIAMGEIALSVWAVEPNQELQDAFKQLQIIETSSGALDDLTKEKYRAVIFADPTFISILIATIITALGLVSFLVGFFTRNFRDTFFALGAGTLLTSVILLKHPPVVIIIGVVFIAAGVLAPRLIARYSKK